ncbi:MAG TPA: hypothetical protein VGD47_09715 [Steroidobacteraceae bacterium]
MRAPPRGTIFTAAYHTNDSFEKVVAFYRGFGKEYTGPKMRLGDRLPNGQRIKKTILILDGASDLLTSKNYVNIQHPFIGSAKLC